MVTVVNHSSVDRIPEIVIGDRADNTNIRTNSYEISFVMRRRGDDIRVVAFDFTLKYLNVKFNYFYLIIFILVVWITIYCIFPEQNVILLLFQTDHIPDPGALATLITIENGMI